MFGFEKGPVVDVGAKITEAVTDVLKEVLGKSDDGIYALTQQIRGLIDPDDAPERLQRQITSLRKQLVTAKNDLADVKAEKVRKEEDVLHLVKIKKEQLVIEYEKKVLKLQAEMTAKELVMVNEHNTEYIERMDRHAEELSTMYGGILKRLPNLEKMVQVSARAGDVSDTIVEEAE